MSRIEESIDVDVPVRVAYDQWTQVESSPSFMDGVESITQTDPTHDHWVTKVGGVTREFDTEVTEQHPDERVAWKSVGGETRHAGVVTYRLDDTHTRLMSRSTGSRRVWSKRPVRWSGWMIAGSRRTRSASRNSSRDVALRPVPGVGMSLPAERPGTTTYAYRAGLGQLSRSR